MLTIEQLRKCIEKVDAEIIERLAKRQALSQQIGKLKSEQGKAIVDPSQEEKLFHYYHDQALKYGLQPTMIKRIFNIIIAYSRKIQQS